MLIVKTRAFPFLRLPPVQMVEHHENLARLPPQRVLISAEPIQRVVREIGKTQKATRRLGGGTDKFGLIAFLS